MRQSKGLLSFIIAFCFIISCISPIQSYAQSTTATDNDTTEKDNNRTIDEGNATTTSGIILTTSEQAVDIEITESAIDIKTTDSAIKTDDEKSWYRKQNPLKKEHQKLLWDYCKKRNLDYIDMLALIYTESNFNEKCKTGSCYGYFQITKGNCASLAATLKTKNAPFDGAVNINWGTATYSWILADKRVKEAKESKKRDVALSIFQRGTAGYDKHGISTKFLKAYYLKRTKVNDWYKSK